MCCKARRRGVRRRFLGLGTLEGDRYRGINFVDVGGCCRISDAAEIYLPDFLTGKLNTHLGPCAAIEYQFQLNASKPTAACASQSGLSACCSQRPDGRSASPPPAQWRALRQTCWACLAPWCAHVAVPRILETPKRSPGSLRKHVGAPNQQAAQARVRAAGAPPPPRCGWRSYRML